MSHVASLVLMSAAGQGMQAAHRAMEAHMMNVRRAPPTVAHV